MMINNIRCNFFCQCDLTTSGTLLKNPSITEADRNNDEILLYWWLRDDMNRDTVSSNYKMKNMYL